MLPWQYCNRRTTRQNYAIRIQVMMMLITCSMMNRTMTNLSQMMKAMTKVTCNHFVRTYAITLFNPLVCTFAL